MQCLMMFGPMVSVTIQMSMMYLWIRDRGSLGDLAGGFQAVSASFAAKEIGDRKGRRMGPISAERSSISGRSQILRALHILDCTSFLEQKFC